MDNQKVKITNLTIHEGPNKDHFIEARYNNGKCQAIKRTSNPDEIRATIKLITSSNPSIYIASFLPQYKDITTEWKQRRQIRTIQI